MSKEEKENNKQLSFVINADGEIVDVDEETKSRIKESEEFLLNYMSAEEMHSNQLFFAVRDIYGPQFGGADDSELLKETDAPEGEEERQKLINTQLEKRYKANMAYYDFFNGIGREPFKILDFYRSITIEDLKAAHVYNPAARYDLLQSRIREIDRRIQRAAVNKKMELTADLKLPEEEADDEIILLLTRIYRLRATFRESELMQIYYLKYPKISTKKLAEEHGAIMTTGGRLADVSAKNYSGWLDEVPNDSAYISYVGAHYWDNIEVDDGGNLYDGDEAKVIRAVRDQDAKIIKAIEKGSFGDERPEEHERINKEVLRALLNATIKEDGAYRTIYLPTFARELNPNYRIDIDEYDDNGELNEAGKAAREKAAKAKENGEQTTEGNKPSIMQQFYSLDYWVGVIDGTLPKRTAIITGLNKEAKTIEVVLPYIDSIKKRIQEAKELEAAAHHRAYILPAYNFLVHPNIDAERDKVAVDLVYTIIDKLLLRGSKPASDFKEDQTDEGQPKKTSERVVYRIKYRNLVKATPLLDMEYKRAANSKREYNVLNRRFTKAFKLLHTKTDIYDYFIDLKIPEVPPTKRTLDDNIVITHKGRNPAYKKG